MTYTSWLQIVLDVLNFNILFIWKEHVLVYFKPLNFLNMHEGNDYTFTSVYNTLTINIAWILWWKIDELQFVSFMWNLLLPCNSSVLLSCFEYVKSFYWRMSSVVCWILASWSKHQLKVMVPQGKNIWLTTLMHFLGLFFLFQKESHPSKEMGIMGTMLSNLPRATTRT